MMWQIVLFQHDYRCYPDVDSHSQLLV